jgi:transcriptional regulator with XRE-family HTH domain
MKNMVAEKIRLERLKQNLSQQNMADELGITAAAYSNLERGVSDITITRLFEVSRILKKTPQWFIDEISSSTDMFDANFIESGMKHDLLLLQNEMEFLKHQLAHMQFQLTKK